MNTPALELPTVAGPTSVARPQSRLALAERDRLIRRAKALSWLSLAYMTAEGAIAITAALLANSVALLGFGLDSAIEGLASIIVIWRVRKRVKAWVMVRRIVLVMNASSSTVGRACRNARPWRPSRHRP